MLVFLLASSLLQAADQPAKAPAQASTVSIRDYAAAGDGSTDDTSAIVAAFSAVCTAGGGTIYVPSGTYILNPASASIPICSDLVVQGPGTLKVKPDAGNYRAIFAPSPPEAAVNNLTFTGISVDQNTFSNTAATIDVGDDPDPPAHLAGVCRHEPAFREHAPVRQWREPDRRQRTNRVGRVRQPEPHRLSEARGAAGVRQQFDLHQRRQLSCHRQHVRLDGGRRGAHRHRDSQRIGLGQRQHHRSVLDRHEPGEPEVVVGHRQPCPERRLWDHALVHDGHGVGRHFGKYGGDCPGHARHRQLLGDRDLLRCRLQRGFLGPADHRQHRAVRTGILVSHDQRLGELRHRAPGARQHLQRVHPRQ